MDFEKITNRIWYVKGDPERDWPNIVAFLGDDRTLIADAGASPEQAEQVKKALEKLGRKADYLVLTHWHWDHSFGLCSWDKTETMAQERTVAFLEEQKNYEWNDDALYWRMEQSIEAEFTARMIKKEYPDLSKVNIVLPKRYFTEKENIDLGGLIVTVRHIPCDHALDHTVLYAQEEKFLFLGDCLNENIYCESWHYTHGRLAILINSLREFDTDLALESHGEEPLGRVEFIDILWQLQTVNETVKTAVEEGRTGDLEKLLTEAFERPLVESDLELMKACLYGYYQ
ncbi:MAG: MBL fold metallo-hydrolase [Spirochaetales bacterium]|nr:MBL fold metallo-hydrolase [Spirochaetales bacterium]